MPEYVWTVFLDRDGVLNRKAPEGDYIKTWSEFSWIPGSVKALRVLHQAGLRVLITTNQQGIAKSLMTTADLEDIHRHLEAEVMRAGGRIDGIYVCPHLAGTCDCRKPGTGLFLQAQGDFPDLSFERSVVIGDSASDIEAGRRVGARTIRIAQSDDELTARSLLDAAERLILPWVSSEK